MLSSLLIILTGNLKTTLLSSSVVDVCLMPNDLSVVKHICSCCSCCVFGTRIMSYVNNISRSSLVSKLIISALKVGSNLGATILKVSSYSYLKNWVSLFSLSLSTKTFTLSSTGSNSAYNLVIVEVGVNSTLRDSYRFPSFVVIKSL